MLSPEIPDMMGRFCIAHRLPLIRMHSRTLPLVSRCLPNVEPAVFILLERMSLSLVLQWRLSVTSFVCLFTLTIVCLCPVFFRFDNVFVFLYFILFYISRQIALTGYCCFVYIDNDNNIALMVHDSHSATFGNCNSINPDVIEDTIKTIRTTHVSARPFCGCFIVDDIAG